MNLNLGKSINELNIWHSTGATIVWSAGDQLLIAWSPYQSWKPAVPSALCWQRISVRLMHNLFLMKLKQTSETASLVFFVKQNTQASTLFDKLFTTFKNISKITPPFIIAEKMPI